MILITKDNLSSFIEYYHGFHDSYITNINYDIKHSQIVVFIDVCWSGDPIQKEDGTYETNKTKMKMVFNGVEQCNNKEIFSWDYINDIFIQYIKIKNTEFICFASDEKEPLFYIVCDNIEYEELNNLWRNIHKNTIFFHKKNIELPFNVFSILFRII